MKLHQFRLETLLRLREAVRDERRRELAETIRAADALAARGGEIDCELDALKRRQTAKIGGANVEALRDADRYDALLREERERIDQRRRALDIEIQNRGDALLAADRDVRALEQLRESHQRRQRADDERRAMKELDEAALRPYSR